MRAESRRKVSEYPSRTRGRVAAASNACATPFSPSAISRQPRHPRNTAPLSRSRDVREKHAESQPATPVPPPRVSEGVTPGA